MINFAFNREGPRIPPPSTERLLEAAQRPIDVLSRDNATADEISGLDPRHLQLLRQHHGIIRAHLQESQQEQLRTMHRRMDLHIQTLQNDQNISPERRKELIKKLHKMAEDDKVALRNHRRDIIDDLKKKEKAKGISTDESRRGQEEVQKITDKHTKEIDVLLVAKEKEMMEV